MSTKTDYFWVIIVSLIILGFLHINFEPQVATAFFIILVGGAITLNFDIIKSRSSIISIPLIDRSVSRKDGLIRVLIALTVFYILSSIIINTLPNQSIFDFFAINKPILAGSVLLTFFVWAIFIPVIETTTFFGIWLEFFKDYFKISTTQSLTNINTWILSMFMGAAFAIFHLSVRFVTGIGIDNPSLLVTFIFGVISSFIVLYYEEVLPAIGIHVLVNSFAMVRSLGII